EVLFVQELMNASRKFPSALFGDDQGRMKVLDAIQESIDGAVAREDEWLAQQEG
ncbi:MAG: TyeA family type III secretion system gatekeeper subunit, partial [Mailhella sp.]|nr:TyeA family type III secretion system gatekeeper subunit [Mailhella sp.]